MSEEPHEKPALKPKQERFAREYARHVNAAKAARLAGYSAKNARRTATRFLNDPKFSHVAERVEELMADKASQKQINEEILIQRLRSRLSLNPQEYFDEKGNWKKPNELTPELAQHIQGWTISSYANKTKKGEVQQQGYNITLRLTNAQKAEEMLGRHNGFFEDNSQLGAHSDYVQAAAELDQMLAEIDGETLEAEREILKLAASIEATQSNTEG